MSRVAGPETATLFDSVSLADAFFLRLRGLLGRPELKENEGLLISPCKSVHTIGMRYSIDVVFLSGAGDVVGVMKRLAPSRWASEKHSAHVLEVRQGMAEKLGLAVGDRLRW